MGKYREGILNHRLIEANKLCDDLREVIAQLQQENKDLKEQNEALREWKVCYEQMKAERDSFKKHFEQIMRENEAWRKWKIYYKRMKAERDCFKEQLAELQDNYVLLEDTYEHLLNNLDYLD